MAVNPLGAHASETSPVNDPALRTLYRVPASSRTRLSHGTFLIGDQLGSIYSSRRGGDRQAVVFQVGTGPLHISCSITPRHARTMARALLAAANALDAKGVL